MFIKALCWYGLHCGCWKESWWLYHIFHSAAVPGFNFWEKLELCVWAQWGLPSAAGLLEPEDAWVKRGCVPSSRHLHPEVPAG